LTTAALYRRKAEPVRARTPDLEHVLIVPDATGGLPERTLDLVAALACEDDRLEIPATAPQDLALMHFTSEPLRDQLDIDSMDALRFVIELKRAVGVDIPEHDYGRLVSLDSTTAYLAERPPRQPS
jgi:hypothetical protein